MSLTVCAQSASAAEIRIVDSVGLVRSVKLVKRSSTVEIRGPAPGANCVAISVDGINGQRTAQANASGVCVFRDIPPGTWQVQVTPDSRWKARIDG